MASVSSFIKEAFELVGQPYCWGGNGETLETLLRNFAIKNGQSKGNTDEMIRFTKQLIPIGLTEVHFQDCSGLIVEILRKIGAVKKDFDATAQGLYEKCTKISKPVEGCLCFFFDGKKHNHVGISVDGYSVIHAYSVKTGVILEPIEKRKEKWVDFGLPDWCLDFSHKMVTLTEDVYVYRTADEALKKPPTSTKWLYKKGDYYIYKTANNCTNISKEMDSAGGWISNANLRKVQEW